MGKSMAGWLAAAGWVASAAAWGQQAPSPGLWEFTMDAKVASQPGFQFPPQKRSQCVSDREAADPGGVMLGLQQAAKGVEGCSYSKSQVVGSTMNFEMRCAGESKVEAKGSVQFTSDSLEGDVVTTMGAADGTVEFRSHLTGRRVGPCGG